MGTLAAGIKEIFATAKTTGSNVMLCGNDGTPDGHITMANLASVLGVTESRRLNNVDLNTLRAEGSYTLSETCTNTPDDGNQGSLHVFACQYEGQVIFPVQIAFFNYKVYWRLYWSNWTDWKRFYDESILSESATLSSLANALGVDNLVTSIEQQRLKYNVVVHGDEEASIDNVKNILSSMFAAPSNAAGVSIVQCVFSGGQCYTCLISHDGDRYFAAQIMSHIMPQPTYVRYANGTWL